MSNSRISSSAVRRAAASALENLESRRLLSYSLSGSVYDGAPQETGNYGMTLASKGGLVLVGSPSRDTNTGQVQLIDTSDNSVVRTFTNPDASVNDSFGSAVAFVGNKIAI